MRRLELRRRAFWKSSSEGTVAHNGEVCITDFPTRNQAATEMRNRLDGIANASIKRILEYMYCKLVARLNILDDSVPQSRESLHHSGVSS